MNDADRNAVVENARRLKVADLEAWRDELATDDPVREVVESALADRSVTVSIRIPYRERERLRALAADRGLGPSSLIKAVIQAELAGRRQKVPPLVPRPALDPHAVRQILGQLGKLGSNANQIAKQMNEAAKEGRRVAPRLEKLSAWQAEMSALRQHLLDALR